uniref:SLPTX4 n=1 Tax=Hemiscolopendra marginata TaxID=943146 RepID=A0A646QF79_9MYRI
MFKKSCFIFMLLMLVNIQDMMTNAGLFAKDDFSRSERSLLPCPKGQCPEGYVCDEAHEKCRQVAD